MDMLDNTVRDRNVEDGDAKEKAADSSSLTRSKGCRDNKSKDVEEAGVFGVLPVVLARFNFGLVPNNKLSGDEEVAVVLMGVVDILLSVGVLFLLGGGSEKSALPVLLQVVPTAAGDEGLINMLVEERNTILILLLAAPPLMGMTESPRLPPRRRGRLLTMVDKFIVYNWRGSFNKTKPTLQNGRTRGASR